MVTNDLEGGDFSFYKICYIVMDYPEIYYVKCAPPPLDATLKCCLHLMHQ